MVNIKNKKRIIRLIVLFIIVTFCIIFFLSHKTNLKYNDWWIIGKSIDEIEDRYGEFDANFPGKRQVGYYVYTDDRGPMPSHAPMYYWIEYDENNIAVEVYVAGPVGG